MAIITDLLTFPASLFLEMPAEGVEKRITLGFWCNKVGAGIAQGILFSKDIVASEFAVFE